MWLSELSFGSLLKAKKNLFVCPQIWMVAFLTHKQQNMSANVLFLNSFSLRVICLCFFNPTSKIFCNLSLKFNLANHRHLILALSVWKLVAFKQWFRCLNLEVVIFQNFWYSFLASSISFNFIWGFRYTGNYTVLVDMLHSLNVKHLWSYMQVTLKYTKKEVIKFDSNKALQGG